MLATTKPVTLRIETDVLDRFDRIVQKAKKMPLGTLTDDTIQNFIRRLVVSELDRLESKVANSPKV
ncbi:hypothetical protein E4414_08370 [Leptospira interrogans]|uniref:hypothetical protein n=1 Tax=Leptospira interrogans TaxID=173 RepID=UPI000314B98A|nr:hypothetical protein [Leptospira interrogans]QCO33085.1 hypothetical protein E4414_08370 [Leptospira interrogans]